MRTPSLRRLALALCALPFAAACLDGEEPSAGRGAPVAECPPPTAAELEKLCGQTASTQDALSRAEAAQASLNSLSGELSQAEAALAELEAAGRNDAKRAAADKKKREELEGQISALKGKISTVEGERDAAREELVATVARLDAQVAKTEEAEAEAEVQRGRATGNQWQAFSAEAKLTICDRGGKRRSDKCHDAVTEALRPHGARFKACVDSGQAAPELRPLDKDAPLPTHAERLPSNARFSKDGWAVVFCDPALPEQGEAAPKPGDAAPTP
jgi:hypothetical protein